MEVEAMQFTETSWAAVVNWLPAELHLFLSRYMGDLTLRIDVPEGTVKLELGDWVVRDAVGRLYSCKDDAFWRTHDQAEA